MHSSFVIPALQLPPLLWVTLLHISFPVNKALATVFHQAEDHFQKLSIKSCSPPRYCLCPELMRITPSLGIGLHGGAKPASLLCVWSPGWGPEAWATTCPLCLGDSPYCTLLFVLLSLRLTYVCKVRKECVKTSEVLPSLLALAGFQVTWRDCPAGLCVRCEAVS